MYMVNFQKPIKWRCPNSIDIFNRHTKTIYYIDEVKSFTSAPRWFLTLPKEKTLKFQKTSKIWPIEIKWRCPEIKMEKKQVSSLSFNSILKKSVMLQKFIQTFRLVIWLCVKTFTAWIITPQAFRNYRFRKTDKVTVSKK